MITRGGIFRYRRKKLGISLLNLSRQTKIPLYTLWRYEQGRYVRPKHYNLICRALSINPSFLGEGNETYFISSAYKQAINEMAEIISWGCLDLDEMRISYLPISTSEEILREINLRPEMEIIDDLVEGKIDINNTLYHYKCIIDCCTWKNHKCGKNKENKHYSIVYLPK